jgi:endonuclease YncB( thermonuclease family)
MHRAIAIVCLVLLCGCASDPAPSTDGRGTVVRVVDGDTIVVHIAGRDEHVRLIGIDTPETHKPGTPVECFGPEASAHLSELLPDNTPVRLERDIEARDRFDRLLAYVYRERDNVFIDLAMVTDGYAGTLAIAPNYAHRPEFEKAEAEAQRNRLGLWAACGGNHVPGGG